MTLPDIVSIAEGQGFSDSEIAQGRQLAGIGNCAACHTVSPQQPYAGGRAIATPFGTIYSANITPDRNHGIGGWTLQDFARAMRQGRSASGEQLFPAFPYTHFTLVSDSDLAAIYAYLMTREGSDYEPPANTLAFPFRLRSLQTGWKLLYFDDRRWEPVADKSAQWNRGAYLAEGLGHCGACHTPRNAFGAERGDAAYAGALVGGWYAPALNSAPDAPVPWTEDDVYAYLRQGGSKLHGVALGSMSEVIHQGLGEASDDDIRALAVYFSDLTQAGAGRQAAAETIIERSRLNTAKDISPGEEIYLAACASCHYNPPANPSALRPELSINSTVTAPDPTNLIRATLKGVTLQEGLPGVMMPGFADSFSDEELLSMLSFLRVSYAGQASWPDLAERVREIRRDMASGPSAATAE